MIPLCKCSPYRDAMRTMVKTYGQTPRQLFKDPHVARNAIAHVSCKPLTTKGAPMQQAGASHKISSRFWRLAFAGGPDQPLSAVDRDLALTPGALHFSSPALCWTAKFPHPVTSVRCLPSGEVIAMPPSSVYLAFVPWRGPRYEQVYINFISRLPYHANASPNSKVKFTVTNMININYYYQIELCELTFIKMYTV